MSLTCSCPDFEPDAGDWYHMGSQLMIMPPLARRRRCRCCGELIQWGEEVFKWQRWRVPNDEVTERIYGEEGYPIAPWWTCEECSDLISAVEDLGFCWSFGEPIADQIEEYRAAEREYKADVNRPKYATVEDYL